MKAGQEHIQRGADPRDVSSVSTSVSSRIDGVVGDTVLDDDFVRRRADILDAEAVYYRHRAVQEERAIGPGYYVDLLWGMACDRAAMAQRIRTHNAAP